MNKVLLVARLTRDPEIFSTGEGSTKVAKFNVAVDRRFKKEGQPDADFPSCTAFGKTAEFLEKYFTKGMKIGIEGRLTTGSYTNKDGVKVYTTDVTVENVEFVESKGSGGGQGGSSEKEPNLGEINGGFVGIGGIDDSELPFV